MASPRLWRHWLLGIVVLVLIADGRAEQFVTTPPTGLATRKAVSDVKDSIVQSMGWKTEEVQISNIDNLETMFGHATIYDFHLQIGEAVFPLRLSEDVKSWHSLEHSRQGDQEMGDFDNSLAKEGLQLAPVLSPFQLAGPLELWIRDADNMRLSLPHDVEAGVLKKVILADGAVVTVKGARELSLRQPIELPLPLLSTTDDDGNHFSNLIGIATKLRHASNDQEKPLSLRIVGLTSLAVSSINEPDSTANKLKVKKLAPGYVELRSRQEQEASTQVSFEASTNSVSPNDMWMWPLLSLNGTDPKLRGIEELLKQILGSIAQKEGSIKLLKAQAAASTFVRVQFELEKKAGDDMFSPEKWLEWRTKPSVVRLQFELTGKVEGDKILPLQVKQIEPVDVVESFSPNSMTGNITFSKTPILYPPPSPFTL